MLQIVLTLVLYLLLLIPVGSYVYRVAAGKHTFADPVLDRVDHAVYKLCKIMLNLSRCYDINKNLSCLY